MSKSAIAAVAAIIGWLLVLVVHLGDIEDPVIRIAISALALSCFIFGLILGLMGRADGRD